MNNNPTIKDVSKYAGVSTATVSRVINGAEGVNPKTVEKVQKALNELNYQVNVIARSLKTNTTKLVGVLAPNFSNVFYNDLFQEIEKGLAHKGFSLIICSSEYSKEEEYKKMKMLLERNVDGIIFFPLSEDCTHLESLNLTKVIPMVMVDRSAKGLNVDLVLSDNLYGAYHLTKALIAEGHKRIGFIGGLEHVSNAKLRYQGYLKAMNEEHLEIEEEFVIREGDTLQNGYSAMERIIKTKNHPNAFLLENQMTHVGATTYLYAEVPYEQYQNICIASYDFMRDSALLTFCHYAMYQPLEIIGREVVKLILNRIEIKNNDDANTIIIKPIMKVMSANGGIVTDPQLQDEVVPSYLVKER
jgi:LacI family transcriptional regulator